MGTKTHNNYEDLITFTRASGGHALRPVSYGSELVTNGTFDSDISGIWTDLLSTSTWEGSYLESVSTASGRGPYQVFTTVAGKIYRATGDVLSTTGEVMIRVGDGTTPDAGIADSDSATSAKSLSVVFIAESTTSYIYLRHANAGTAQWDNISVKEVTFDQPDGTLTLFEHPDNVPRVEYDADSRNRLGLLVEEARTNLIANSDFDAGVITSTATITADTVTSPDGTQNAATLELTGSTSGFAYYTVTVTASTDYTWSWFAKAGTATAHVYAVYDNSNAAFVSRQEYTLTSGKNYGNGWYRHQVAFTTPAGCTEVRVYPQRNTDAGGAVAGTQGTMFVWGGQLEAATFESSIIRTTGSTASRSADVQDIQLANFGYNHNKGTVLVEFSQDFDYGSTGFPRVFEIGDPSTERVNLFVNQSTGGLVAGANFNNVNQAGMVLKTETDGIIDTTKVAYAFADDNFAASDDGDTVVTDTSGTFSGGTPRTKLLIGPSNFCGHIKSIKYYPRRLTNAQLQEITS